MPHILHSQEILARTDVLEAINIRSRTLSPYRSMRLNRAVKLVSNGVRASKLCVWSMCDMCILMITVHTGAQESPACGDLNYFYVLFEFVSRLPSSYLFQLAKSAVS